MSKKTILMLRHCQSEANMAQQYASTQCTGLTKQGKKDRLKVCEFILNQWGDRLEDQCYSSDLARAKETIVPLAREAKMSIHEKKRLREIDLGQLEGQDAHPDSSAHRQFQTIIKRWKEDGGAWRSPMPQGESAWDATQRIREVSRQILRVHSDTGKVMVIATHRLTMSFAVTLAINSNRRGLILPRIPLGGIIELGYEYRAKRWEVSRTSSGQIKVYDPLKSS